MDAIKASQDLRFLIGGISLSMRVTFPNIKKSIRLMYKDYNTYRKPDIIIDTEYRRIFDKPNLNSRIFQGSAWNLCRENGHYIFYFGRIGRAILNNSNFNKAVFYTRDRHYGQTLSYLFPQLLFSLNLIQKESLLLHACGVLKENKGRKGYLFIARSGGGKTTLANLALKEKLTVLNDDRIIIRREKKGFKIYGNPWGKNREYACNKATYVQEAFFLKKAKFNQIKPMGKAEAVIAFLKNSFSVPVNTEVTRKKLDICSNLAKSLDCYWLSFKPNEDIWRFLHELAK